MKSPSSNTNPKQDLYDMAFKRTICIDFDGVVHWYRKGWQEGVIYDDPVPGAFDFIAELVADDQFEVAIYSSRSKDEGGVVKMQEWFYEKGMSAEVLCTIEFPTQKPAAWLTIDDRCFQFRGIFPTPAFLLNYNPWMGRPELNADVDVGAWASFEADGQPIRRMSDSEFLRHLHFAASMKLSREDSKRINRIANELEGRGTSTDAEAST